MGKEKKTVQKNKRTKPISNKLIFKYAAFAWLALDIALLILLILIGIM